MCRCGIVTKRFQCGHFKITSRYCSRHQAELSKEWADSDKVWETVQFYTKEKKYHKKVLEESQTDKLVRLGAKKYTEYSTKYCDQNEDRLGGVCDGFKVTHPERFQSMNKDRDRHGVSDILLFGKYGDFLAYAYFKHKNDKKRSFWWPKLPRDKNEGRECGSFTREMEKRNVEKDRNREREPATLHNAELKEKNNRKRKRHKGRYNGLDRAKLVREKRKTHGSTVSRFLVAQITKLLSCLE